MKRTIKSAISVGLAVALSVSPIPTKICNLSGIYLINPQNTAKAATVTNVKTYDELLNAVQKSGTVNITANIKVTAPITIAENVSIILTSGSDDYIIYPSQEMARLFTVNGSLQLGASATDKVVKLRGGTADEKRITNSIVYVDGGKFTNYSGMLYKSKARALRLLNGATGVLYEGSNISTNTGLSSDGTNGGAITVGENSTLKIKGGTIKSNDYGGIYCAAKSEVIMTDGTITSNSIGAGQPGDSAGHGYGGGVYCNGTFEMSGGTIKGNAAQKTGDGVYITENGKFYISKAAMISDNDVALAPNARLYVADKLTGTSPVAKITPNAYTIDQIVVSSSISAMNASEFADKIVLSNSAWQLKASGQNLKITKEYKISYDANGGEISNLPEVTTVYANDIYTVTDAVPERTGHTFKGWNTEPDGSGSSISPSSSISITGNVKLYAQWEENDVTVTYDANGGEGAPESCTGKYTQGIVISSDAPTRTGYTFKGWNTEPDGSGIAYTAELTTHMDLSLYAQWEENDVTVTYDANGGEGAPESCTGKYTQGVVISSDVPTRTGYTFKGWNTEPDGSGYTYIYGIITQTSLALYAQWEENDVTVTYDANGGEGAPESCTGKYTQGVVISSDVPTRTGYTFKGWNTEPDGSGSDYMYGMTTQTSLTLYAQWSENLISITYDANGGSDAPAKQTASEVNGIKISTAIPTRAGYTFKGWNTEPDGSGITYTAGSLVKTDIVLYAQWEKLSTVKISLNCSDSNITLNSNSTNTYTIKCKKKLTFTVKATFDDSSDGVAVYYQIVKKGADYNMSSSAWTAASNGKFTINKSMKNRSVYIKVTAGGQTSIVKTYGFTIDITAPTVTGVKNGKTYKSARTIKVTDSVSGVKSIKLDGKTIKSGKKVSKKGSHTLVVKDNYGNSKTIKFKIK